MEHKLLASVFVYKTEEGGKTVETNSSEWMMSLDCDKITDRE